MTKLRLPIERPIEMESWQNMQVGKLYSPAGDFPWIKDGVYLLIRILHYKRPKGATSTVKLQFLDGASEFPCNYIEDFDVSAQWKQVTRLRR